MPLDAQRWAVSEEVVASSWRPWQTKTEVLVHGSPVTALAARGAERDLARRANDWGPDDVVVAIVANLRSHKDYPTLFRAAAEAIDAEPRLRFVSIGQGPLETELRAELDSFGLGDRFVMLGYHHDPPAVLAGADIFTLSSVHEGLPISLVEAMAMGLPPVVTAVGRQRRGRHRWPRRRAGAAPKPGGARRRYVALARDPARRAALGKAAAARAEDFDVTRTARILEARYRALVDER